MAVAVEELHTQPYLYIVKKDSWVPPELSWKIKQFSPKSELGKIVKQCLRYLPAELAAEVIEKITQCVIMESSLALVVKRHPSSPFRHGDDLIEDYGIVSRKKVTTAGVTALAVAWANATFDAKYMALGTNATAESNAQTGLIAEIAANHYTASVRVSGTHAESDNTVPIVGTHTQATAGDTIEEHGIYTSATVGAPTLWDRSLTGTVALAVGDSLTGTYVLTAQAEA